MFPVRHRASSGPQTAVWEFDSQRKCLDVVLQLGSTRAIAFTLPVCAPDRARAGAHPVMRLDGQAWRVLPAVFVLEHAILVPRDAAIHATLAPDAQLVLTHAPADIDAELASL